MATLNVTIPDPFVPRVQAAFGKVRNLGRDATAAEVQEELRQYMKGVVLDTEGRTLKDAVVVPSTGI